MRKSKLRYKVFKTAIAFVVLLQCQRLATQQIATKILHTDPLLQVITSDSIILRWDKPKDTTQTVTGYELLYRIHGDSEWTTLKKQIAAKDSPWIAIYRNEINSTNSLFDFAIRALYKSGDLSRMSISIDSLSSPRGGWFLKW